MQVTSILVMPNNPVNNLRYTVYTIYTQRHVSGTCTNALRHINIYLVTGTYACGLRRIKYLVTETSAHALRSIKYLVTGTGTATE